jgi:hypothetical protein
MNEAFLMPLLSAADVLHPAFPWLSLHLLRMLSTPAQYPITIRSFGLQVSYRNSECITSVIHPGMSWVNESEQ